MIVLSFPAKTADLILSGEQTVVTYEDPDFYLPPSWLGQIEGSDGDPFDLSSLVGQPVGIAGLHFDPCDKVGETDQHEFYCPYSTPGAIVGLATVAAVEQITRYGDDPPRDHLCAGLDGRLRRWTYAPVGQRRMWMMGIPWDVTDQLPFADFTPGRWAVILTDPDPCWVCEECGLIWLKQDQCRRCGNRTRIIRPIPYDHPGPVSEWSPS